MTPDTFRRSPETIPGRRLRLEKIHSRHAPAFHASVQRSMADLDFIAWGHHHWNAVAALEHCERQRDWVDTEGEGVMYLAFEHDTGTYVGCVDLHSVDFGVPRCQLGFVGCSRQRGRGLVREAALTLMDWPTAAAWPASRCGATCATPVRWPSPRAWACSAKA